MNKEFKFEKSRESNVMKTVRFPESLYNDIDNLIKESNKNKKVKNILLIGFVVSACKFALENMNNK